MDYSFIPREALDGSTPLRLRVPAEFLQRFVRDRHRSASWDRVVANANLFFYSDFQVG